MAKQNKVRGGTMDKPIYEQAEVDHKKGMKYKDIAEKYNVTLNTVKSWKTRHWGKKSVHTKKEKVCIQKSRGKPKKGAPIGNKNSVGHAPSVPLENKNAEKHGFFSKWLPEETVQIIGELASTDPLDLLWNNILLQCAAILRAQNIMHVTGKDEIIKEVIKTKVKSSHKETEKTSSDTEETETEYAFQFAWDRQATFMNAQSRAQTTLNNMIKQYDELLHKNWDLATEEQKARIEALKKQAEEKEKGANEVVVRMEGDIEGWGE